MLLFILPYDRHGIKNVSTLLSYLISELGKLTSSPHCMFACSLLIDGLSTSEFCMNQLEKGSSAK